MASRRISLSEDAYQALLEMKRPDETISTLMLRLTRRRSLTELAQVMTKEAADQVAAGIDENRTKRGELRWEEH